MTCVVKKYRLLAVGRKPLAQANEHPFDLLNGLFKFRMARGTKKSQITGDEQLAFYFTGRTLLLSRPVFRGQVNMPAGRYVHAPWRGTLKL